jgi:hypothetical protein
MVRLMGRCVLWAGASYGPVRLMGRCVLWAGASYRPGNTINLKEIEKRN